MGIFYSFANSTPAINMNWLGISMALTGLALILALGLRLTCGLVNTTDERRRSRCPSQMLTRMWQKEWQRRSVKRRVGLDSTLNTADASKHVYTDIVSRSQKSMKICSKWTTSVFSLAQLFVSKCCLFCLYESESEILDKLSTVYIHHQSTSRWIVFHDVPCCWSPDST